MSKYEKLLLQILRGSADANIPFDDLCQLLRRLGFEERTRGSHHILGKKVWKKRSIYNVTGIKLKFIKCVRYEPLY